MASVFRRWYAKPIPAGAEIRTVRGKRVAKFTDSRKRSKTVELTEDGTQLLLWRKCWYIAYKDAAGKRQTVKGYTDREATESLARRLEVQAARRKEGLFTIDPDKLNVPIGNVIKLYCEDLEATGKDDMYVYNCRKRLEKLAAECDWQAATNIRVEDLTRWRQANAVKKAPRTLNQYVETLNAFIGFAAQHHYLAGNPIEGLSKSDESDKRRLRRGLDLAQLRQLLNISGDRWQVYLTAMKTGLRRDELGKLQWGDVHLEGERPHIHFRGTANKSRREDCVPLEAELVVMLMDLKPADAKSSDTVFASIPAMETFKKDLAAAGIDYKDAQGRQADFHSLRKSYNMLLSKAGVPVRVAMQLMRHTDIRLTTVNYISPELFDMGAEVEKLPKLRDTGTKQSKPGEAAG